MHYESDLLWHCVVCNQLTNWSIIHKCAQWVRPSLALSIQWGIVYLGPSLWSLHSLGIWQSSNRPDFGREWAGEVKRDDVSLRRKLGCSKPPSQEPSSLSPLWFLICSLRISEFEGKRIHFQSDPKVLQEHHSRYLFRNLARLPAPIPGVIHPVRTQRPGHTGHGVCPQNVPIEALFDFCFSPPWKEID